MANDRQVQQEASGPASWIGGHGTVPEEQNTQQSPVFGRKTAPQPVQS